VTAVDAQGLFHEHVCVADAVVDLREIELVREVDSERELVEILSDRRLGEERVVMAWNERSYGWRQIVAADVRVIRRAETPVLPGAVVSAVVEQCGFGPS